MGKSASTRQLAMLLLNCFQFMGRSQIIRGICQDDQNEDTMFSVSGKEVERI